MGSPPPSPPIVSINCPGYDPVGTSRTFTATTNVACSIAIYFDGELMVSGSGTSLSYNAVLDHAVQEGVALFLVTRMTMRSLKTRVPPVTALRSPPLSRMTGADSP